MLTLILFQTVAQLLVHLVLISTAAFHHAISYKDILQYIDVITTVIQGNIRIRMADGRAVTINQLVIKRIYRTLDTIRIVAFNDMHLDFSILILGNAFYDCHKVKLPMRGGAESLNAAVAAGIMMYELTRDLGE